MRAPREDDERLALRAGQCAGQCSGQRAPQGKERLRFPGDPGRTYTIERALAVTGPWTPIHTPTAPINGLIEYVVPNPTLGAAFYRTSTP